MTSRVQAAEIDPSTASKETVNKILIQLNYFRSNYELWKRYIVGADDKDPTNPVKYQLYKFKELSCKIWHIKYFRLTSDLAELAKVIEAKTIQFKPLSFYLFKHAFKSMTTISIFC